MALACGAAGCMPPAGAARWCGMRRRAAAAERGREREAAGADAVGRGFGMGNGDEKRGRKKKKAEAKWKCAPRCGACCKLDKGPAFPAPDELFADEPAHLQLYKSLIGPDGWCVHYDHAARTCSIYQDRPFFCRVEPEVFQKLFGIRPRRFDKAACSSCVDTITAVYGSGSEELKNFNRVIRSEHQK